MNTLSSLINNNNDNVIANKILNLTYKFNDKTIFLWIPDHCGIIGNERADVFVKEKANNPHQYLWNTNSDKDLKKLFTTYLK